MSHVLLKQVLFQIYFILFLLYLNHAQSNTFRLLTANLGNIDIFQCWETKLCDQNVINATRKYLQRYQPDVILFTEMMHSRQLHEIIDFLPPFINDRHSPTPLRYTGVCGESRSRHDNSIVSWNATNASHEHECIAWKPSVFESLPNSMKSSYGLNDQYGREYCSYDFTGLRIILKHISSSNIINFVVVHPNARNTRCRTEEISAYWHFLVRDNPFTNKTIIGGDFNCGVICTLGRCTNSTGEIQRDTREFIVNYSNGMYWNLHDEYPNDPTVNMIGVNWWLDHVFSSFGNPCTDCGKNYGTEDLRYGAIVGGYMGHPRIDGGHGMDHRQILVDYQI